MTHREILEQLRDLAADAERCATVYEERPGLVLPATISDLYRAIGRLAALVSASTGPVS